MKKASTILLVVATIYLSFFAFTAWAAWSVFVKPGAISVHVHERRPGGDHVVFFVPAFLANLAIRAVPLSLVSADLCDENQEAAKWIPVLRAAAAEIEHYEDLTLVAIDDEDEHVRVVRSGGALRIEVRNSDEHVSIRVPARTVRLALNALQEL